MEAEEPPMRDDAIPRVDVLDLIDFTGPINSRSPINFSPTMGVARSYKSSGQSKKAKRCVPKLLPISEIERIPNNPTMCGGMSKQK